MKRTNEISGTIFTAASIVYSYLPGESNVFKKHGPLPGETCRCIVFDLDCKLLCCPRSTRKYSPKSAKYKVKIVKVDWVAPIPVRNSIAIGRRAH